MLVYAPDIKRLHGDKHETLSSWLPMTRDWTHNWATASVDYRARREIDKSQRRWEWKSDEKRKVMQRAREWSSFYYKSKEKKHEKMSVR